MSPKLKTGLIVAGSILGVLVVAFVALVIIGAIVGSGGRTAYQSVPAAERVSGEGGGYYPAPQGIQQAPSFGAESVDYPESMPTMAPAIDVAYQQPVERMIIRNGNVSMAVEDTRVARQTIEQMVDEMADEGAFIVSSNEYGGSPNASPYIDITIRVPALRFDEAMERITALAAPGTSPTVSASGQDVTAEYVDLQARLASLEAARDRLLELMRNAETTEDLLMAEQQLTQREAEIESIKGQMQYLAQSAALSSISISLQPYILSQPVDTRWRPAETVRAAFDALINGLRNFGDFLIYFAIAVLPWLVLFGAIIYGIVRFVMWRVRIGREKRAARAPTNQS
jgi:hypothetical protein